MKGKEGSVEPSRKRKEGLEVTSRKNTPTKREEGEEEAKGQLVLKRNSNSNSNRAIKLGNHSSRERDSRNSNPKRSAESLEREEQRAKVQNKELINSLMQQPLPPNYMSKLKIKKL